MADLPACCHGTGSPVAEASSVLLLYGVNCIHAASLIALDAQCKADSGWLHAGRNVVLEQKFGVPQVRAAVCALSGSALDSCAWRCTCPTGCSAPDSSVAPL